MTFVDVHAEAVVVQLISINTCFGAEITAKGVDTLAVIQLAIVASYCTLVEVPRTVSSDPERVTCSCVDSARANTGAAVASAVS